MQSESTQLKGRVTALMRMKSTQPIQPIANAAVSVTCKGEQLPETALTDAEGRFELNSLPHEPVLLTVAKAGYTAISYQYSPANPPPNGELNLSLGEVFTFSGTVVDAEDGKPIPAFTLIPGWTFIGFAPDRQTGRDVFWEDTDQIAGANGTFSVVLERSPGMPMCPTIRFVVQNVMFLMQAEGYLPEITPAYDPTGRHQHDFKLRQGQGPHGVVLDPAGQRVEGAAVGVVGLDPLFLAKGSLVGWSANASRAKTDGNGAFQLPARLPSPSLVVVHPTGIAEVTSEQLLTDPSIRLQKWGRIEGLAKAGTNPWANQEFVLTDKCPDYPWRWNYSCASYKAITDAEGRFALDHVPPGQREIVRLLKVEDNAWVPCDATLVMVKPGETTRITIGGVD